MKGTYENIIRAIEKRPLPTGENINLQDQFLTFFNSAATYYSLLVCYDSLKKVHKNLHAIMIEYDPDNNDDYKMDILDYMALVRAWDYYCKTNTVKGKSKGELTFFEKYLDLQNWDNIVSLESADRIREAASKWYEQETTHSIGYMNIEAKIPYVHLLKDALTRKKENYEDSANALLTTHAEEQIIGLLDANQEITDINLFFQLSMITSWLTCESIRNAAEKEKNDSNAYFTSICNINPLNLIISINDILQKYLLPDDRKAIEKLKCDLALPESSDKTFSPLNDYLKLYRALVPCCLKWVDQYEEVWKKVECDPIYQEMTEKLK